MKHSFFLKCTSSEVMDTNGTAVMEWIICNVWLKRVSRRPSICCFPVFVFFLLVFRLMVQTIMTYYSPSRFQTRYGLACTRQTSLHTCTIYTNTHKQGSTSHLNDGGSLRCECVYLCVVMMWCLAGLSVENSSFGVENSSFAVWEAFVVLCRQCCYACRNVSLRINVGILSSDRREREIDQSPPQSQPALQPKRLDYQESFENLPICPQHAGYDLILKHAGRLSLTVEHPPTILTRSLHRRYRKHHFAATNGCVRAAVFMLLEACKIIVMYSVWICPFLLRSTVESIISCQTVMSYLSAFEPAQVAGDGGVSPMHKISSSFYPLVCVHSRVSRQQLQLMRWA